MVVSVLSTSELAKAGGVSVETLRFYEREGLLPDPPRSRSGYRQYGPRHVERVRFVVRAKGLGFTLREIRELLELSDEPTGKCEEVRVKASAKIEDVLSKIDQLEAVKSALETLVTRCESEGSPEKCPILSALTDKTPPE